MADPITLGIAAISTGASIAGGLIAAKGSKDLGQAQSQQYTYQAGVAQVNKQIADQNAAYAVEAGEVAAQTEGMQTRAVIGQTKAVQAAGGLDVNSGSNLNVRQSEATIGEQNQMTIRSNAAREAYGFQVQGVSDTAQGTLDTMAAKTSVTAGNIGAETSILGTAGSVSSKWLQFGQQGIGSGLLTSGGGSPGYYGGSPGSNPLLNPA